MKIAAALKIGVAPIRVLLLVSSCAHVTSWPKRKTRMKEISTGEKPYPSSMGRDEEEVIRKRADTTGEESRRLRRPERGRRRGRGDKGVGRREHGARDDGDWRLGFSPSLTFHMSSAERIGESLPDMGTADPLVIQSMQGSEPTGHRLGKRTACDKKLLAVKQSNDQRKSKEIQRPHTYVHTLSL